MKVYGVTGTSNDGVLSKAEQKDLDERQALVAKRVQDHWAQYGDRQPYPLVAMPTGFGKSRVINRLISEKNLHTLLVVGAKNILLDQTEDVLSSFVSDEMGTSNWTLLPNPRGQIVLATWQGLVSHFRKNPKVTIRYGLSVIDEVHNIGTKQRLAMLGRLNPRHTVGLTATAYRSSGDCRVPEEYGFTIVDSMPLPECINNKWLSPLIGLCVDTSVSLPSKVKHGDSLNTKELYRVLRKHKNLFPWIADDLATRFLLKGMKTIIVVNRVKEEACVIAEGLMKRGFKVGLAVNQAAAKLLRREFITLDAIRRYKLPHNHPDSIQVLISPQVIGEGFDAPATECIVWAAPTMSALRYTQVVGRGARRCRGKKYCLVIDYVYMIENYGYSYNFSQFLPKEDIQELENGLMYVGPENLGENIILPDDFLNRDRMVSMVRLKASLVPESGDWLTCARIAQVIGKNEVWVQNRLDKRFSDKAEVRRRVNMLYPHYPPWVLKELQKEAEEQVEAGGWLTASQIGKEIGRSQVWAVERLNVLFSDSMEMRLSENNKLQPHYPPTALKKLRKLALKYKKGGAWLTACQIVKALGRSQRWVKKELENHFSSEAETRLDRQNKPVPHYPPSVIARLTALMSKSADNWLSVDRIAAEIGKSRPWTQKQLDDKFANKAQMRASSNNRQAKHYPPGVLKEMQAFASQLKPAGNWLNSGDLQRMTGKSGVWVRKMLKRHFSSLCEQRLDRKNVPRDYYPPSIIVQLRKMS